jgi:hypothetical protein
MMTFRLIIINNIANNYVAVKTDTLMMQCKYHSAN